MQSIQEKRHRNHTSLLLPTLHVTIGDALLNGRISDMDGTNMESGNTKFGATQIALSNVIQYLSFTHPDPDV